MALSTAKTFLTDAEINLMKVGLSLRIYSAKVEMFSQMAENKIVSAECNNFVDVGGQFICNLDKVKEYINKVSNTNKNYINCLN